MTDTNNIDIKSNTANLTIKNMTFVAGTLHAPSGTANPTFEKKSDRHWVATLKCDRDGSADIARAFNDACGGYYHEYVARSWGFDSEPEKLNLCFAARIEFSYKDGNTTVNAVAPVVYLAQGHAPPFRNNWWIGSFESITNGGTPYLTAGAGDTGIILEISGGVSDFQFTWKSKSKNFLLKSWMKDIADTRSLRDMTLTGTHDTCALYGGLWAETQKRVLKAQLEAGVRFIDIRCRHIDNVFAIHHGAFYQHINFGDGVLKVCLDFLAANPTETIMMSVKQEYDPSNNTRTFEQTFKWYLDEYNCWARWWLGDTMPAMKDARGKIVLYRRFVTDTAGEVLGLKAEPYEDDKTFTISATVPIKVQDQWKVATVFARSDKWNAMKSLLDEAKKKNTNYFYVNYGSGNGAGSAPSTTANYVNPHLTDYLANNIQGRYGAVLIDFETDDLNRLIAETNF
ncbi:MAG: phosphatidylinositol-specific phospholipase C [Rhizomicrobium sp.]